MGIDRKSQTFYNKICAVKNKVGDGDLGKAEKKVTEFLSHQSSVLTAIPRRQRKMQIAEVRAVRAQASSQQCSSIASGRCGITKNAD